MKYVHVTSLLDIRPPIDGEMVDAGQFAKDGDMIIEREWPENDWLITKEDFEKNYVKVRVTNKRTT